MIKDQKIALILLSAGRSSRMGQPKQFLKINGIFLLQYVLNNISDGNYDTYLVTGAYRDKVKDNIKLEETVEIYNEKWQEGMGSSIVMGVSTLHPSYPYEGIIVSVADQVLLSRKVLNEIVLRHEKHPEKIIVSNYGTATGPPVLFPKKYFNLLIELGGDSGAKSVLSQLKDHVIYFDFPEGAIDLDTIEDYQNLKDITISK